MMNDMRQKTDVDTGNLKYEFIVILRCVQCKKTVRINDIKEQSADETCVFGVFSRFTNKLDI